MIIIIICYLSLLLFIIIQIYSLLFIIILHYDYSLSWLFIINCYRGCLRQGAAPGKVGEVRVQRKGSFVGGVIGILQIFCG